MMASLKNKRFYKVISLFIKITILVLSFSYIWEKVKTANQSIDPNLLFTHTDRISFLVVCALVFVNWGLESIKWKLLIAPLEHLSFFKSMKSVLSGVTISIFTPNRVGEFAGRVFFLEKADKIQASFMSMIGSIVQLSVTIIFGFVGYFILRQLHFDLPLLSYFISLEGMSISIALLLLTAAIWIFIYRNRNALFIKYKKYIDTFSLYSKFEIAALIFLSVVRYLVFTLQYFLILKLVGVNERGIVLTSLIALTFFVTSAIPTFALTEIAVRGATAVFFFNSINAGASSVVAASLVLWIVNLACPAIAGAFFIGKIKFFKDHE